MTSENRSLSRMLLAAVAAIVSAATSIEAQKKAVIETSTGTIEILGLRTWTLDMLNDSLRAKVGFDFNSADAHACAAELRYKLGFADAAAIGFSNRETGRTNTLVTLAEPQDSARIKYRDLPYMDTTGGRPEWTSLREIIGQKPRVFQVALANAFSRSDTSRLPASMWADWWAIRATWAFLDSNRTAAAQKSAIESLAGDRNIRDRQAAIAILVNFGDDDATWVALSQAMLEREGSAKFTALLAMRTLVNAGKKPSDWSKIAPAVHAVLDGTSQFMMLDLLALLNKINPGPTMAKPFLKNGGSMLLGYASSDIARARETSLALLKSLRGKDLGADVKAWTKWVESL